MAVFLDLFGFLAVLLRAATLALGSVAIGGVLFTFLVNRREPLITSGRRLLVFSTIALAVTEGLSLFVTTAILAETANLGVWEIAGADFFIYGCVSLLAAALLTSFVLRRHETSWMALACAAALLACEVATSHAAARVTARLPLLLLTAIHQGTTSAWIGGMPYLLLSLRVQAQDNHLLNIAKRFSRVSLWSVALLLAAGAGLSFFYIGHPSAIYGTNYGLMVVAKVILFAAVLALGAINFRIIRQLKAGDRTWTNRIARIGEAEIGIGITIVLAAASLTSQPPGVDMTADRVTMPAILARLKPEVPRLDTPPFSSLSPSGRELWRQTHPGAAGADQSYIPGQYYVPPTPSDIAWSEYNHHWSGVVVLLIGLLAILSRFERFRWARHWPLAFLGLAVFLLIRSDAETWPLGPDGFWESFTVAEVAQHRIFVLLIVLFAAFEWGIQTGRLKSQAAALVFPSVCALGGALLLTHTHSITNIQEALLAELSHLPLALFAVVAGWARWLELRYTGPRSQWAAHIWPVSFALIGVVLLLYREA